MRTKTPNKQQCVVAIEKDKTDPIGEYFYCGKPVYGWRGDWRMCQEHFNVFDPDRWEGVD